MPAMVERCRDWEHTATCEYLGDFTTGRICSCGKGKVNSRFRARAEWSEFEKSVVPCALTQAFPVLFVEPTRLTTSVASMRDSQRAESQSWGPVQPLG